MWQKSNERTMQSHEEIDHSNHKTSMCLYGSIVDLKEAVEQEMNADVSMSERATPPREKLQQRRKTRHSITQKTCDECEEIPAQIQCTDCELDYCTSCDTHRHRKGALKFHNRHPIASPSPEPTLVPSLSLSSLATTISSSSSPSPLNIHTLQAKDSATWGMDQVSAWLTKINLEEYQPVFRSLHITGQTLLNFVSEDDLERDAGIIKRVHRRKLFREIQKLKNANITPRKSMMSIRTPKNEDTEEEDSSKDQSIRLTSPVASRRARLIQGQSSCRNDIQSHSRRASACSTKEHRNHLKQPTGGNRRASDFRPKPSLQLQINDPRDQVTSATKPGRRMTGLALDLDKISVEEDPLRTSFSFSAEGTLTTQGFEINTGGIASTPFERRNSIASNLGIKDSLIFVEELGQGAGGKVYKALHVPTLKLVAVKVVRLFDKNKRHQMVNELKSLYANLTSLSETIVADGACPALVKFYDAFTNPEKGTVSIVLELLNGGSLEDLVQSGVRCSEEALASIAKQTLTGLQFLHDRHQLHRDIKPSNILFSLAGEVKISDFGISRDLENTLAKATTFTGTLTYMSPERIAGGHYSYPSDIWSVGLALFACAIGRIPLPVDDGYWGVVHAVQQQPSPALQQYGNFSPALCDFLDACLRKDPYRRPSASELLQHEFLATSVSKLQLPTVKTETPEQKIGTLKTIKWNLLDWYHTHNLPVTQYSMKQLQALATQLNVPIVELTRVWKSPDKS